MATAAGARTVATRPTAAPASGHPRARIVVDGVVQGVGYRPFVWRLATGLGLVGRVSNVAGRVVVDAAGPTSALAELERRLAADAPPHARVATVTRTTPVDDDPLPDPFVVAASTRDGAADRHFPPDLATCPACLAEVRDPRDRRYRYAFTNCTDCGPRATIIEDLPYDRAATTMAPFPLCDACDAEYHDPADRRFHAEPVACPTCGPRLVFQAAGAAGGEGCDGDDALAAAARHLRSGRVVAVKGLGGYHLACDATDEQAVSTLRERKHRWAKPFAVMVADLPRARRLAEVDPAEAALLTSAARPIVLLRTRAAGTGPRLAPAVGLGATETGVLLPYTPLHHLLLAAVGRPLVMTSANLADEPLVTDDDEARTRLAGIADAFLSHDRRIRARYDDSVLRVVDGRPAMLRRGRGHAPTAVPLPVPAARPLLAVGAELKHTFTLARGSSAHVSPHGGDLEDLATHDAFTEGLAHLGRLLALEPELVVHDLHPEYLSTKLARARFRPERRMVVQHHHAHVASCAAEHGLTGQVLGVAYDGLGMGDDGTFWGGEVLLADLTGYRRLARFGRAPLPGGALAVRRPLRMALGYLLAAEEVPGTAGAAGAAPGHGLDPELWHAWARRVEPRELAAVTTQVRRGLNAPVASSAGRLFDAAAALLGLRDVAEYEAQAAVDLERAAGQVAAEPLPYRLERVDGLLVYDPRPTLAALLAGGPPETAGAAVPRLAAALHETVVEVTAELLAEARRATGVSTACLSGGVLQNRRLATSLRRRLGSDGFEVLTNEAVPCNDGGISYGQAAVAAARTAGAGSSLGRDGG